MKHRMLTFAALAVLSSAWMQAPQSPYRGQESRELKALSADEVRSLTAGEGMGLAKVAELNHYPGPKHVLELADKLALTPEQRTETQRFFDEMRAEAVSLGEKLIEEETALEKLFASGQAGEEALAERMAAIGRVQGDLRATHLRAHIRQHAILTHRQIAEYVRLRGYADGGHHGHHPGDK